MKDVLSKLLDATDTRAERPHGVIVVGKRALPGELEALEAAAMARFHAGHVELPIPFYEDYELGILEIAPADLKAFARLGITREEYEILILEDRLALMEYRLEHGRKIQ
jgi:hypothetical protein